MRQVTARQQCSACHARTHSPATQVHPTSQHCAVLGPAEGTWTPPPSGGQRVAPGRWQRGPKGHGAMGEGEGGAWGRRERRDRRCANRGVATSSPAWPGQPYPVRLVESAPGAQTPDTRHQTHIHTQNSKMIRGFSAPSIRTCGQSWGLTETLLGGQEHGVATCSNKPKGLHIPSQGALIGDFCETTNSRNEVEGGSPCVGCNNQYAPYNMSLKQQQSLSEGHFTGQKLTWYS